MRYGYRSDDELKDSGVKWIDKIPKSWKRKKLKHELEFSVGATPSTSNKDFFEGENTWVTISDLNGKYCGESKTKITQEAIKSTNMKKVPCNSLLYSFKLSVGQVAFTTKDLYTNEAIASFYPNKKYNLSFWYYALKTYLIENANENIYGAKLLNQDLINNANVFVPNKSEQEKIANFLDEKTSQFDLIISKKEKLIERLEEAKKSLISEVVTGKVKVVKTDEGYELVKRSSEEMKDSGVEWLGEIPKNWEVKRIKQISSVISKGTTPSTVGKEIIDKGEIRFLKAENIYEGKISLTPEFFIDEETNKILKRSELKENDILFVIAGATIGKVAIVQKEHCPANTNQAISFIRLYNDVNYKFVYYWLNSPKLQENMWLYAVQSAQPNLSMENLGNFYITYPCNYEIDILTDYIEKKDIEINDIIKNIKYQIEKLKEAKQSLISEAVTGKIEILD